MRLEERNYIRRGDKMTDYNKQYSKNKKKPIKKYETYVVNSPSGLNIRDIPNGEIIGVLSDKTKVSFNGGVKEQDGNTWLLVKAGNYDGYVMDKYLKRL